jgi:lipopolysaccharide transport system ATP-binding protein
MSEIAIVVKDVSKKYRLGGSSSSSLRESLSHRFSSLLKEERAPSPSDFWALQNVSFQVNQGSIAGIIGKNGAGKSTLLKLISNITKPTSGQIDIYGRIASLLEVGTGFHPELTGRENIFLNGTILGMSRREVASKLEEIVEFSGVSKFIDTPVKRYSSGMSVRLAFAVAAHLEPEILIIDEVLAVGDAEFQKRCLGKMNDISRKEGRTVLFVSHNLEAVQNLCHHAILLQNGKLIQNGGVKEVVSFYTSHFLTQNTFCTWESEEAPGNVFSKLRKAKIFNTHSGSLEDFRTDSGFTMELELELLHGMDEPQQLDITYHLVDERGILVTVESTAFLDKSEVFLPGLLKVSTSFPAQILNEGIYTFSRILLVKNKGTVLTEWNDLLSFEILSVNTGHLGWQGQKEGVIKLKNQNWTLSLQKLSGI